MDLWQTMFWSLFYQVTGSVFWLVVLISPNMGNCVFRIDMVFCIHKKDILVADVSIPANHPNTTLEFEFTCCARQKKRETSQQGVSELYTIVQKVFILQKKFMKTQVLLKSFYNVGMVLEDLLFGFKSESTNIFLFI